MLSADGTTISWEIETERQRQPLDFGRTDGNYARGILADASAVGDGEDVTAVVRVNGEAVHRCAQSCGRENRTRWITEVTAASGLQCRWALTLNRSGHHQVRGRFSQRVHDDHSLVLNLPRHSRGCDRDGEPGWDGMGELKDSEPGDGY